MIELTEKQATLLLLLAEGEELKDIAVAVGATYQGIRSTAKRTLRLLKAKNIANAVFIAMRDGLLGNPVQRKARQNEWTSNEIAILKSIYVENGSTEALKHLPGRSLTALYAKTHELGITCKKRKVNKSDMNSGKTWKASEIRALRNLYPSQGPKGCAKLLGRSYKSVLHRAALEGVRYCGAVIRTTREIPQEELDPPIVKKIVSVGSWKTDNVPAIRSVFDMGVCA
jgi:DNA-binding CsgD family transcriptional regulator